MQDKKTLSLVVPCYNEEETIPIFYNEIQKVEFPEHIDLEVIFVDDGSKDTSALKMKELAERDSHIHYVILSRNFGKEGALFAGLENAKGDYVATMDVDLQDPPTLLPEMLSYIESGEYDTVATRRVTRKGEPVIRSFFARKFYKLINKISDTYIVDGARDYRLMTRTMVDSLLSMKEVNRFSKGLFSWVGFKTKWLEYENIERSAGETKWSLWKLFKYSIEGITAFSTVPLYIATWIGGLTCFASLVYLIFVFVSTLAFGNEVSGYPSLMCVILFLGGVQLLSLGIIGNYLAKTYLESKHRPIYIAKEIR